MTLIWSPNKISKMEKTFRSSRLTSSPTKSLLCLRQKKRFPKNSIFLGRIEALILSAYAKQNEPLVRAFVYIAFLAASIGFTVRYTSTFCDFNFRYLFLCFEMWLSNHSVFLDPVSCLQAPRIVYSSVSQYRFILE